METDNQEYRTIVLAGLLHDIGKLLQRGSFGGLDIKGKHPTVSANFITVFAECFSEISDVDILKTLVQKHHEAQHFEPDLNVNSISDEHVRTLAKLVSLADNLSSAERGAPSTGYQDYKEIPLASVLERTNNSEATAPVVRFHSNPLLTSKELHAIFPMNIQTYDRGELTQFIRVFGEDFSNLFKTGTSVVDKNSFECVVTHLYSLLAKYTWCLPSNTQEVFPDVSLFDHLRTTSAIASCLYLYHSRKGSLNEKAVRDGDNTRFLLVGGDISGIQNYIFDIATTGVGGVARRLRARSLYVQLCSEVASHLVLLKLGLSIPIHTLMNSGGHFYLLLPNIDEVTESIQESQKEIDNWFLKELNGELALNLAEVPFGDDGFRTEKGIGAGFGMVMESVNERLDKKKKNRFSSMLRVNNKWQESSFEIPLLYQGEESCQSCRKFPQVTEDLCPHCYLDRDIGKIIPEAKFLAFYDSKNGGDIQILNHSVSVNPRNKTSPPYLITKIDDTDLSEVARLPATFKYIAKTIPKRDDCPICQQDESPIATFECIAGRAEGDNLLGFLKMDIDNLGETVIFGLKPNDSISRVTTMSRMFDLFFAGWVEHLAKVNNAIYTIFSGGDDLFLVGPWDLIMETAKSLRNDFQRFTNNPKLTISAGVVINGHNYPIATAAEEVKTALDASKARDGKNCITVLGHTLKWDEWQKISGEWLNLKEIATKEKIPTTFLHNLLAFAEMWEQYCKGNTLGLRYHPLLSYNLRRNVNPRNAPKLTKWTNTLLSVKPGDSEQRFLLDNLGLIVQLLILSSRGGE